MLAAKFATMEESCPWDRLDDMAAEVPPPPNLKFTGLAQSLQVGPAV